MIKAIYNRKEHRMSIEGHAYSGAPGHDLVCASASILAYTLALNIDRLAEMEAVSDFNATFENGHAVIECQAHEECESTVTVIFDSVCIGFKLLAQTHPQNISFDVEAQ